jgi:hypothetical protein
MRNIVKYFKNNLGIQSNNYQFCECGLKSAQLLTQNLFPSKPLRSSIVFDLKVLKLLHQHLMFGIGRVHDWSQGLRAFLQAESLSQVPDFYRHVRAISKHFS